MTPGVCIHTLGSVPESFSIRHNTHFFRRIFLFLFQYGQNQSTALKRTRTQSGLLAFGFAVVQTKYRISREKNRIHPSQCRSYVVITQLCLKIIDGVNWSSAYAIDQESYNFLDISFPKDLARIFGVFLLCYFEIERLLQQYSEYFEPYFICYTLDSCGCYFSLLAFLKKWSECKCKFKKNHLEISPSCYSQLYPNSIACWEGQIQ